MSRIPSSTTRSLAALLMPLALAACSGPERLLSRDLELICTRKAEGRPAVTALAFTGEGPRLAVGDYRGELELLDPQPDATAAAVPGSGAPAASGRGEILALGLLGGEPVAVRRSGDPFAWGRLTGATASQEGAFVGWSRVTRKLFASGAGDASAADVAVAAATIAGDRVYALIGRDAEASTLQCRVLPTLAALWSIELGHAALALAADEASGRLLIGDASGVDVRALADGALLERVDAGTTSIPCSLRDGRRVLLVQGETLAVLELAAGDRPARIEPGFLAHRGGVTAVAVSADGAFLATGGARGDVRLFRILSFPAPGAAP